MRPEKDWDSWGARFLGPCLGRKGAASQPSWSWMFRTMYVAPSPLQGGAALQTNLEETTTSYFPAVLPVWRTQQCLPHITAPCRSCGRGVRRRHSRSNHSELESSRLDDSLWLSGCRMQRPLDGRTGRLRLNDWPSRNRCMNKGGARPPRFRCPWGAPCFGFQRLPG